MSPNLDARLTGAQVARAVGVSRQLVHFWYSNGLLDRGADGLYRYGDALELERQKRGSALSNRNPRRLSAAGRTS